MSEQEFMNEMITLGYRMDGKFTLQKIGPENVYVFLYIQQNKISLIGENALLIF